MKLLTFLGTSLLIALLCLNACKTKQNKQLYTPDNFPEAQIVFGEGGGFTGAYTIYYLLFNGQVLLQKGRKAEAVQHKIIPKAEAEAFFQELNTLGLKEMKFEKPSNWSQFIEYKSAEISNKIIWGKPENKINAEIQAFYDKLIVKLIKPPVQ